MLKLFYAPGTCALASHIALIEANVEFEAIALDFKSGEQRQPAYLHINPKGRVPALATPQGTLTENPAILAYIAQTWPDAELAPTDPFAFAEVQAFNMYLSATVHPTFAHAFRPERYADSDAAKDEIKAKVPSSLATQFELIEAQLEHGPWVHGTRFTISDPYLHVFCRWLKRSYAQVFDRFPRVGAHFDRVAARPATQAAVEAEA